MCPRTLACEGASVLKVKDIRPHYKVKGSHRTQLTLSPRLPSQVLPHTTVHTDSIQVLTNLRFKTGDGTFVTLPSTLGIVTSTRQDSMPYGSEMMEESLEHRDNEETYKEAARRAQ